MSTLKARKASTLAPARPRRGISLIEALVAMAVMAFGMLGVLGMQATLRANADISKQRSEATRLAQEKIEAWRSFSVIPTTAGVKSYADIATEAAETLTSFVSNTTYTRTTTVTASTPPGHKTMVVDVSWEDRSGTTQNVRLFSAVAQISPDLAATMVARPQGSTGVRQPEGRRRGIPPQAKNFGDGTSGFIPPQTTPTVAWVFNNVSGLITSVCTTTAPDNASLTLASLSACVTTQAYQLISGYIRFDTTGAAPTATSITNPTSAIVPATIEAEVAQTAPAAGTIACRHAPAAATYREFFCAVPVTTPTPATWSGTLQIRAATLPTLSPNLADVTAANRKVCRYRALVDPVPTPIYQNVGAPLANENLAVIAAGNGTVAYTCPNPPTRAHQPAT